MRSVFKAETRDFWTETADSSCILGVNYSSFGENCEPTGEATKFCLTFRFDALLMEANNTTSADLDDAALSVFYYTVLGYIGAIAVFINLFILSVFFSSKHLLNCSSLLVALTIAHVFNGLVHSINGFWSANYAMVMVRPSYCVKILWPNLFITTYVSLPLLLSMAGMERLLAVAAPVWYHTKCTHRRQWYLSGVVLVYAFVVMGLNWFLAWINSDHLISASCVPPLVVGIRYMVYGVHIPAVLGGVCATICTAIAVRIGRKRMLKMPASSQGELGRVKKHVRLAKCLLMISSIDVICVVIPNITLILYNLGFIAFPLRFTIFAVMVYCSDSIWNIIALITFNNDFRHASKRLLFCGKAALGSSTVGDATITPH